MKNDLFGKSRSVEFLIKKCRKIFKEKYNLIVYFPGYQDFYWPKVCHQQKIVDVVLFGNALHLLTHPFLWPHFKSYRFWVLSIKHQEMLVKIFGLQVEQVGLIPRHLIEGKKKSIRPLKMSGPLDFVMSSRLSDDKNIDFSLHFINHLQNIHNKKVTLTIYFPHGNKESLKHSLTKFKWSIKPTIKGDKGFTWYKDFQKKHPIYFNASTSYFEDFSVATMQAQKNGWPVILSDWGVFKEITPQVFKIPFKYINEYRFEKNNLKKEKIIIAAVKIFFDNIKTSSTPNILKTDKLDLPLSVKTSELKMLQSKWTQKKTIDLINTFSAPQGETTPSTLSNKLAKIFSSKSGDKNV